MMMMMMLMMTTMLMMIIIIIMMMIKMIMMMLMMIACDRFLMPSLRTKTSASKYIFPHKAAVPLFWIACDEGLS